MLSATSDLSNWMADLPDSVRISEISIPGTHDTLTDYSIVHHDATDTQDKDLPEQLALGIRFWDIRLRKVGNLRGGAEFHGTHGGIALNVQFDKVLIEAKKFLEDHPEETLLMRIKTDHTTLVCPPCPSDAELAAEYLTKYMGPSPNGYEYPFLYNPPGGEAGGWPTLQDVRGKMVWFLEGFAWGDHYQNLTDIKVVNDDKSHNADTIFGWTRDHLAETHKGTADTLYRMGMTGENALNRPYTVAKNVNAQAEAHFAADLDTRTTGIITMDFPETSDNLIRNIIKQNDFASPGGLNSDNNVVSAGGTYVNVGGPELQFHRGFDPAFHWQWWKGDRNVSLRHNNVSTTKNWNFTVNTNGIDDAAPPQLFQSERWDQPDGEEMQWDFAVQPGDYRVRLFFAENHVSAANERLFDVKVEGKPFLTNYDVFANAGGKHKAVMEEIVVTVDDNLDIDFSHVKENPMVNGIEFRRLLPDEYRANVGGPKLIGPNDVIGSTSDWESDKSLAAYTRYLSYVAVKEPSEPLAAHSSIVLCDVVCQGDEVPRSLFETERWDPPALREFEFDFPVRRDEEYEVSLYFVEKYFSAGGRQFDIRIDGVTRAINYDIHARANGNNTAIVEKFKVKNLDGNLDIQLMHKIQNPTIAGIKIERVGGNSVTEVDSPSLKTSSTSYGIGEDISVDYVSPDAATGDWIGIYKVGDTPGVDPFTTWQYVKDVSGTLSFSAGLSQPGQYNAYLFCCDQFEVYASTAFEVTGSVTPDPPSTLIFDITSPSDAVLLVSGENDGDNQTGLPPASEGVSNALDNTTQKYLNFKDLGSGLIVTPSFGATLVTGLRFYTANDAPERDPASFLLEGSNNGANGPFATISQMPLSLPEQRNPTGLQIDGTQWHQEVAFGNATSYTTYRLTFPTLVNSDAANSVQIGEVEFLGDFATSVNSTDPLPGDVNGDGSINFTDFLVLASNFGESVAPETGGDLDGDGRVAFPDYLVLAANFGKSIAAAIPAAAVDDVWADEENETDEQDELCSFIADDLTSHRRMDLA